MDRISKIGLAVCIALLAAYYAYNLKQAKKVGATREAAKVEEKLEPAVSKAPSSGVLTVSKTHLPISPFNIKAEEECSFSLDAQSAVIDTDYLTAEFSNDGGVIRRLVLKENPRNGIRRLQGEKTGDVILMDIKNPYLAPGAIVNPLTGIDLMRVEKEENNIKFNILYDNGIILTKRYIFQPKSYQANLEITIENRSSSELKFSDEQPLDLVCGSISPIEKDDILGIDVKSKEGMVRKNAESDSIASDVEWLGLKTKYFAIIIKPDKKAAIFKINGKKKSVTQASRAIIGCARGPTASPYEYLTGTIGFKGFIRPGGKETYRILMYCGPADYNLLRECQVGFEDILNLGSVLKFISIGIIWLLDKIFSVIHSYGWAIIILTVIAKVILWPLTHKSYKSMKEMQRIQPLLEPLKEKYRNDQKKLQSETWKLYKEHGINPMGGCLPMLLQMPILIALYNTLRNTILLRKAPFWIIPNTWIKDLSGPDVLARLSSPIPLIGNDLNILPLLMGISFFLQQKLTPTSAGGSTQAEQQQKMMSIMMPVLFTFIFYSLPSGLNLYFFFSTAMSVVQQFIATKRK